MGQRLRLAFASKFLCGMSTPKKITLLSVDQGCPLFDYDSEIFHTLVESLRSKVSANLKFLRYRPLSRVHNPLRKTQIYYHRETPFYREWWYPLPDEECEQDFAEARTPRIVPVGKWDWET